MLVNTIIIPTFFIFLLLLIIIVMYGVVWKRGIHMISLHLFLRILVMKPTIIGMEACHGGVCATLSNDGYGKLEASRAEESRKRRPTICGSRSNIPDSHFKYPIGPPSPHTCLCHHLSHHPCHIPLKLPMWFKSL